MNNVICQRALAAFVGPVLLLASSYVLAAPFAYSVNSDAEVDADLLYEIDLATGQAFEIGNSTFEDVEGLAYSPLGQLFGVDDASDSVIHFDIATGVAIPIGSGRGNLGLSGVQDYGLTFVCDGRMFIASDNEQTLYQTTLQSTEPTVVGSAGGLGARITGLAAWGDEVYGIGSEGSEGIYRINTETGQASLVLGLSGYTFNDGGLAFDEDGVLWALLDKSFLPFRNEPSLILRIDLDTSTVTQTATTLEGFESLAIAPATGCVPTGPGPTAIPVPVLAPWALILMSLAVVGVARRRIAA